MMMHSRHQIIRPRTEHQHQHPERGKIMPMIELLHRHHNMMGNNKSHNTNTGSNEPTSRFVPSQPNNSSSSSQGMDSLNTTMVYYEKSNGEHQGKCASIQMSPRNTVSTGVANTTQTTNQKALQVDGTQTTPPSFHQEAYFNRGDTNIPPKR